MRSCHLSTTCTEGQKAVQWLQTLCQPDASIQPISWFQVNVLFEFQLQTTGMRHNKNKKRWENSSQFTTSQDFVARSKNLSKWMQGVAQDNDLPIVPMHLRPSSEVLTFWTMCIPLGLKLEAKDLIESLLRQSSPKLTSVQSLTCL